MAYVARVVLAPRRAAAQTAAQITGRPATAAAVSSPLPKGPRAMMLGDWYRVVNVSAPAVSPDGKRVAMTVTKAVEGENRRHNEIWVVNTAGGEPQRWTSPNTESSNPRWSPDGKYLFFTSQRAGGKGNTWAIRLDQPSGEAVQVPEYPSGSMPADGAFAVFTDAAAPAPQVPAGDPFAQQQPMARPPFDAVTRPAVPARFDGRHVVDMVYKNNNTGFVPGRRTPRTWRPQQLFRQNVGDTTKKQITNVAYSHRGAVVSPDGKWVAFVADARLRPDSVVDLERDSLAKLPYDKGRDEVDRNDADVFVISVDGGAPRKVVEWMGAESNVTWSPDGKSLAYIMRVPADPAPARKAARSARAMRQ
jgi:Tol biopolymer transport system component